MQQHQLDAFRESLLALRSELEQLQEARSEAAETVTLDQAKVGRLSRMDAMQAQQMAEETSRRRQLHLQKIEGALRRIALGEYGDCFKCGEEIGEARLHIDPTSTRCISCMGQ